MLAHPVQGLPKWLESNLYHLRTEKEGNRLLGPAVWAGKTWESGTRCHMSCSARREFGTLSAVVFRKDRRLSVEILTCNFFSLITWLQGGIPRFFWTCQGLARWPALCWSGIMGLRARSTARAKDLDEERAVSRPVEIITGQLLARVV